MKTLVLERGPELRRRILLALVFGVPVIFLRSVNDPFNVPKLSLLIVGVALVLGIRAVEILQGAGWGGLKLMVVPAAAIVAPLLIAWLFTPYKGFGLFGIYGRFQGLIPYAVMVLFGLLLADAFEGRAAPLAWAFVLGGAVTGAYALIQAIGADPFTWALAGEQAGSDAIATIGNPNFTGGFLGVVLPVSFALVVLEPNRRPLAGTALVLIIGGWLVANSQGGWGAGVAGTALTAGYLFAHRHRWFRPAALTIGAVAAAVAVGSVVAGMIAPDSTIISQTVKSRGDWWGSAVDMAKDYPIVGRGPNAFGLEGVHYRPPEDAARLNYDFPNDPHSVFFSFLANAGIIGGAGFIVLLAWSIRRGAALQGDQLLGAAFFGAVTAYFVQSFVSIDEISLRLAFWVSLGGLVSATMPQIKQAARRARARSGSRRRPRRERLQAPVLVGLIALLTAGIVFWGGGMLIADGRVLQGVKLMGLERQDDAIEQFEAAIDFRSDIAYRHTYGYQVGQVALARAEQGFDYMEKSREAYSYLNELPDIFGMASFGRILHAFGPVDEASEIDALEIYRRAVELDPLNPLVRVEEADVLIALGRAEEAIDELLEVQHTGAPYAEYWGALALGHASKGDVEAAQESIDLALGINPEDPRAVQAQELLAQQPD